MASIVKIYLMLSFFLSLKVQFNSDTIDETNILEETLKPRVESFGGTIEKVGLSGNHITPCIQVKLLGTIYNTFHFIEILCCFLFTDWWLR